MSKFLKFIVHFAVICTIVCVLGLALPPFFGVRTVIMDSTDKAICNLCDSGKNRGSDCRFSDSCTGRWQNLQIQSCERKQRK